MGLGGAAIQKRPPSGRKQKARDLGVRHSPAGF